MTAQKTAAKETTLFGDVIFVKFRCVSIGHYCWKVLGCITEVSSNKLFICSYFLSW